MNLTTMGMCFLADILSSYSEKPRIESHQYKGEEYVFVQKKTLSDVYDAYLYISTYEGIYAAWLVSKDSNGSTLGWQFIHYKIAAKIFPILKSHSKEYLKNETREEP